VFEDPMGAQAMTLAARASCDRYQWTAVRSQWLALYRSLARPRAEVAPSLNV
jgi:hypothetical protein